MPTDYSGPGTYMNCCDVLFLELLYPTPYFKTPTSDDIASEYFFNLEGVKVKHAIINGVAFLPPDVPVLQNKGANQCTYPVSCKYPGKVCTHTVYLNQFNTATRFVISSKNQGQPGGENLTHPIHMHSYTFFIAKIVYPEYYENGTMKAANKNLSMSQFGPPEWRNVPPEGISVTSTTIRKSTAMVPASGYLVIHFFQDNPGYWLMHCHTDWHLNDGMAIAISENPERASTPPELMNKNTKDFCFSVKTFISKEAQYPGYSRRKSVWIKFEDFILDIESCFFRL
jgi:iron transport multicopper oxidase